MQLKEILRRKGITAKELASKLGISATGLSMAVKNGSFSLQRIREIAAALDVNPSDLLADEDTHPAVSRSFFAQVYADGQLYFAESLPALRSLVDELENKQNLPTPTNQK